MKVKDLIDALSKFDSELNVSIIYDGEPRMDLDVVYESKSGEIMVTCFGQPVYTQEFRPIEYNGCSDDYYKTPKQLEGKPSNLKTK